MDEKELKKTKLEQKEKEENSSLRDLKHLRDTMFQRVKKEAINKNTNYSGWEGGSHYFFLDYLNSIEGDPSQKSELLNLALNADSSYLRQNAMRWLQWSSLEFMASVKNLVHEEDLTSVYAVMVDKISHKPNQKLLASRIESNPGLVSVLITYVLGRINDEQEMNDDKLDFLTRTVRYFNSEQVAEFSRKLILFFPGAIILRHGLEAVAKYVNILFQLDYAAAAGAKAQAVFWICEVIKKMCENDETNNEKLDWRIVSHGQEINEFLTTTVQKLIAFDSRLALQQLFSTLAQFDYKGVFNCQLVNINKYKYNYNYAMLRMILTQLQERIADHPELLQVLIKICVSSKVAEEHNERKWALQICMHNPVAVITLLSEIRKITNLEVLGVISEVLQYSEMSKQVEHALALTIITASMRAISQQVESKSVEQKSTHLLIHALTENVIMSLKDTTFVAAQRKALFPWLFEHMSPLGLDLPDMKRYVMKMYNKAEGLPSVFRELLIEIPDSNRELINAVLQHFQTYERTGKISVASSQFFFDIFSKGQFKEQDLILNLIADPKMLKTLFDNSKTDYHRMIIAKQYLECPSTSVTELSGLSELVRGYNADTWIYFALLGAIDAKIKRESDAAKTKKASKAPATVAQTTEGSKTPAAEPASLRV